MTSFLQGMKTFSPIISWLLVSPVSYFFCNSSSHTSCTTPVSMAIDFTSTHRTLNNTDILPLIIEHLYSRSHHQGFYRRRHLSPDPAFNLHGCTAFARVCKAFLEPALDVLWRAQVNFRAIFALVPQLLDSSDSKFPVWSLCTQLTPAPIDLIPTDRFRGTDKTSVLLYYSGETIRVSS